MADWNDIKKAFERDTQKASDAFAEKEQRLLKQIANYLCSAKDISVIQSYRPGEVTAFLQKPLAEIKSCLGGEWLTMSDDNLETLIYSLSKKVKKSENMMQW